jgi:hypothetical protein
MFISGVRRSIDRRFVDLSFLVLPVILILLPRESFADVIRYTATGVISNVVGFYQPAISAGQQYSVDFTLDSSAAGSGTSLGLRNYSNARFIYSLKIDSGAYALAGNFSAQVRDAPDFGILDLIDLIDFSPSGASIAGQSPTQISLARFLDYNTTILSSTVMPFPLPTLGSFTQNDFRLVFSGGGQLSGEITSLTVASEPKQLIIFLTLASIVLPFRRLYSRYRL